MTAFAQTKTAPAVQKQLYQSLHYSRCASRSEWEDGPHQAERVQSVRWDALLLCDPLFASLIQWELDGDMADSNQRRQQPAAEHNIQT